MTLIYRSATFLLLLVFCGLLVSGCSSQKISDKPGEDMNSAMTAQQKALNAEHKRRGEQ